MGHCPVQRVTALSTTSFAAADVEAIERATLDVVVPDELLGLPGWLVPVFDGSVGRARSAVPLHHAPHDVRDIDTISELYLARGFAAAFRLPEVEAFRAMHGELQRRGFERQQPTLVLTGKVADVLAWHPGPPGDLSNVPDAQWMGMFLGPGLDPVDGAARSRALARGASTQFASLRENGVTLACGAAALSHGWLSVHGMRTLLARRGEGLASRVMLAMALHARQHGVDRIFLQVDAANAPALALYRRCGLQPAWRYAYWLSKAV
jgi:N-acetylglutamate synthase